MKVRLFHPTQRNTQLVGIEFTDRGDWLELYFSYETIVAFRERGNKVVVSQNFWSVTTGRHLNEIDGGRKEDRIDADAFQRGLDEALWCFFSA